MTLTDPFADLDARLISFFAAQADAAVADATPVEEIVERLERRVGRVGRASATVVLAPPRSTRSWIWVAIAAAALVALVAGSLLVGNRPRLAVVPDPSGSPVPSVVTGPFALGTRGSVVVARLSADRLSIVSVGPDGLERTVGSIDRFSGWLGDGVVDDGSLDPSCWRFCLPALRVSSTGLLDVSVRRGTGASASYANLVFDLTSPGRLPITLPDGLPMWEPDGTLLLETGNPLDGTVHILRYQSPTATPSDLAFPSGLSPAFSQWTPTSYAIADDGSGVFATRADAKAPNGVDQVILHWDGSTAPATGVEPMFTTGSDRILSSTGDSAPFSGLWDRAGDVSCGPAGGSEHPISGGVVHVFCAGPDKHPSPLYPAGDVTTDLPDSGGIVGFTDSAALLDLWDPAAAGTSTIGGHVTDVVPLDGSPSTAIPGLLISVVQSGASPAPTGLPHHNGPLIVSPGLGFEAVDPVTGATTTFRASGRSLAWSPDGTRIASIYADSIWIEDMQTAQSTRVTSCCGPDGTGGWPHPSVSWSPDGTRLAYADAGEIYTINVDGSGRTQVTHLDGSVVAAAPAWSPDGTRLAYTMDKAPTTAGAADDRWIVTSRLDGTETVPVSDAAGEDRSKFFPSGPIWAPDGGHIAYLTGDIPVRLVTVEPDGSDRREVFSVPDCCMTDWGDLAWSPDGTRLATTLLGSGPIHDWSLYVMDMTGANVVELAKGMNVGGPAWRPVP